jgi:hypothetical protein
LRDRGFAVVEVELELQKAEAGGTCMSLISDCRPRIPVPHRPLPLRVASPLTMPTEPFGTPVPAKA